MIQWNSPDQKPPIDTIDQWNMEEGASARLLVVIISNLTNTKHITFGQYWTKTNYWSFEGFKGEATVLGWSELNEPIASTDTKVSKPSPVLDNNQPRALSPNDTIDPEIVDKLLIKFNKELLKKEKGENYYHLVISGEYPRSVLDSIENKFKYAGWPIVKCQTSSENGERFGLTGLQLWRL